MTIIKQVTPVLNGWLRGHLSGLCFYYGCLKNTPYKWFNVKTLITTLLSSQHVISEIKYFTTRVSSRPEQPNLPKKQALYFRALKTISI